MLPQLIILAGLAAHSQASVLKVRACDGETTKLFCYTPGNGESQSVDTTRVAAAAKYLRAYGRQVSAGRRFTMTKAKESDPDNCAEWAIHQKYGVQVAIKHIDDTIDSSVLFEDIATTIDGGEKATAEQKAKAIISCSVDGGTLAVQVNSTHPAYSSAAYIEGGFSTNGLLVKITKVLEEEEQRGGECVHG